MGSGVTVGRFALVHACTVADDCVIGDAAVIMDDAEVGPGAVVAHTATAATANCARRSSGQ